MKRQEEIMKEIFGERERQDRKWGGESHDDMHNGNDWIAYIIKQLGRAIINDASGQLFRAQMVKVASLAVAAIEWHDRAVCRPVMCNRESVIVDDELINKIFGDQQ